MSTWDDLLSPEEREVIRLGGYGQGGEAGSRPCVIVIDMQRSFLGSDSPMIESVTAYPGSIGERAWQALRIQCDVLSAARHAGVPIVYTQVVPRTRREGGEAVNWDILGQRIRRAKMDYEATDEAMRLVDEIAPQPDLGDVVLEKNYASSFYATPLLSYLVKLKVDTLLIMGVSTSGCVRATAVDASSMNFTAVVIEDCVADRIEASHKVALLDIWMKYGHVWSSERATGYLSSVHSGGKASGFETL